MVSSRKKEWGKTMEYAERVMLNERGFPMFDLASIGDLIDQLPSCQSVNCSHFSTQDVNETF